MTGLGLCHRAHDGKWKWLGALRSMRRFEGTDTYVATQDLQVAVNAAIALERPLLVKGEPGTGKTILAHESRARHRPRL